ncbi:MAG: DUF58 domain-containing protein [Desulfobulbaceae bacterium]|jgi:uncharacterized protein (DUF58 family)|nr:DUF58 domain-containing protein [Desulfobulbaceae bacterium]
MINKELQHKIRHIQIMAKKAVTDILAGEYHSVFKGRGMEFDEVREYQPGDDIRTIDWNVTARTGVPHIKRYVEERELTVLLLVDLSGSGQFGSAGKTKNEVAAELCGLLAFSAIRNNDKAGLLVFTDDIELYIPPRKGTRHVLHIIREVLRLQPKGRKTDINLALNHIAKLFKKKAVLFLISDFRAPDFSKSIRVAAKRHDIITLSITDPAEMVLPKTGLVEFRDNETGEILLLDSSSKTVRKNFKRINTARQADLATLFKKQGIDHIPIMTEDDYVSDLVRFFKSRDQRKVH